MERSDGEVPRLMIRWKDGDREAYERLAALVYPEIRAMAQRRARGSAPLGASTLVSETYLKFLSAGESGPADRQQFFSLMATIMRQVIIDEARSLQRLKRAGRKVTLNEEAVSVDSLDRAQFLIQVDEIVDRLKDTDERMCRVFECRFFAGLTTAETAEAVASSERTVERLWSRSRQLVREMLE
ncbi:MAG: ECF-type sigma factor [Gammaproteobacteria bacterium]